MDSSSSSLGFPLSGNPESPQNSSPSHSSTVGIPGPANPQSTENLPPVHSSYFPDGIPLTEIPQSAEPSQNQHISCNGQIMVSDTEWNEELTNNFSDLNFCFFMKGGVCQEPFVQWYGCMHRAIYLGEDKTNCSNLAGVVRDCILANVDYHRPYLRWLSTGINLH